MISTTSINYKYPSNIGIVLCGHGSRDPNAVKEFINVVDILKSRIDVYLNETSPLIDLYKKKNILKPIDGMQSVEKVSQNIEVELNWN